MSLVGFLSAIQAGNQSIDTSQDGLFLCGMERMQAGMIIYSTRKKHVRACVVFSLKRSLTVPINLRTLSGFLPGNEIKFQAIEEVG